MEEVWEKNLDAKVDLSRLGEGRKGLVPVSDVPRKLLLKYCKNDAKELREMKVKKAEADKAEKLKQKALEREKKKAALKKRQAIKGKKK